VGWSAVSGRAEGKAAFTARPRRRAQEEFVSKLRRDELHESPIFQNGRTVVRDSCNSSLRIPCFETASGVCALSSRRAEAVETTGIIRPLGIAEIGRAAGEGDGEWDSASRLSFLLHSLLDVRCFLLPSDFYFLLSEFQLFPCETQ